ncbi:RNA polymerase sigma factor [uncultured Rossellomorea sp.]|uniref:RNA polymerase sigma factor n=1 Tax=uncultured Rossellomorea sp. TaxID=2837549 RepID=UPI00263613E6|nr:RNA polymerase sigma factor [uncultured Rossellomorea sp.]
MENEHLIERAKKGDLQAYSHLITYYFPIVERFAYQMGNSIADIPDITQEVFIRVYRFLDGFSYAKFTTWLYKITLNVSRDFKRKENQHNNRVKKIGNEPSGDVITPQERILRQEEDRMLHECIQMLDDKYQIPIILTIFMKRSMKKWLKYCQSIYLLSKQDF